MVARRSVAQILEERMRDRVSEYVEQLGRAVGVDRRNGSFSRHLLTELGDIELHVPRAPGGRVPCRFFVPMGGGRRRLISSFWPVLSWGFPPARWPIRCCLS